MVLLTIAETLQTLVPRTSKRLEVCNTDEYDDLTASNSSVLVQRKQISHRLNVLSAQVERVGSAINEAEEYSYQFNVKIVGLPELKPNETAPETSSLCVKLFQEMGAEVSILDIDIAHRVSTRNGSEGPKPVIFKFVRRLAKGKLWKFVKVPPKLTLQVSVCLLITSLTGRLQHKPPPCRKLSLFSGIFTFSAKLFFYTNY